MPKNPMSPDEVALLWELYAEVFTLLVSVDSIEALDLGLCFLSGGHFGHTRKAPLDLRHRDRR